jgi:hypothetical protein
MCIIITQINDFLVNIELKQMTEHIDDSIAVELNRPKKSIN